MIEGETTYPTSKKNTFQTKHTKNLTTKQNQTKSYLKRQSL